MLSRNIDFPSAKEKTELIDDFYKNKEFIKKLSSFKINYSVFKYAISRNIEKDKDLKEEIWKEIEKNVFFDLNKEEIENDKNQYFNYYFLLKPVADQMQKISNYSYLSESQKEKINITLIGLFNFVENH